MAADVCDTGIRPLICGTQTMQLTFPASCNRSKMRPTFNCGKDAVLVPDSFCENVAPPDLTVTYTLDKQSPWCAGSTRPTITVTISNNESSSLTDIACAIVVNGHGIDVRSFNLGGYATETIAFAFLAGGRGTYLFEIIVGAVPDTVYERIEIGSIEIDECAM